MSARSAASTPASARRRGWWLGLLLSSTLLAGLGALLLDPALQKRLLIPRLAPLVEQLDLDYVRVTPWSLELRGLKLSVRGARLSLDRLELGVNPLRLLGDTLSVRRLQLEHAVLNLENFVPPPADPAAPPFPGLLAALDLGYGLALGEVSAALEVRLPNARVITLALGGGGLRPHQTGELTYDLQALLGPEQHVHSSGTLSVEQLSAGAFRGLQSAGTVELQWPGLPAAERLAFALDLHPAPGMGAPRARYRLARAARAAGATLGLAPAAPEVVSFTLRSLTAASEDRAKLSLNGVYAGEFGAIQGDFQLLANERLGAPYAGGSPLPSVVNRTAGTFGYAGATQTFELTLTNDLLLGELARVLGNNPALPASLNLHSAVTLAGQPTRVVVTRFEHTVAPDAGPPVLTIRANSPLTLDPAQPEVLLATPRALGVIEVAGLPLPWLNGLLGEVALGEGALRGGFEVAADKHQRLVLNPVAPLIAGPVTVSRAQNVLVSGLTLQVLPKFLRSQRSLSVSLKALELRQDARRLLNGQVRLRQKHAPDSPARLDLTLDLDLDAITALPGIAPLVSQYALPQGLLAHLETDLESRPGEVRVKSVLAQLAHGSAPELFKLKSEQAFTVPLGTASPTQRNPRGVLARLEFRNLNLAWLSPWLPDGALEGRLSHANFGLMEEAGGALVLSAGVPLEIRDLSVQHGGTVLAQQLAISVAPRLTYSPDKITLALESLEVRAPAASLLRGRLVLGIQPAVGRLEAAGKLTLDGRALLAQPVLAAWWGPTQPALKLSSELNFDVGYTAPQLDVQHLEARVAAGKYATLSLVAEPGLVIRTALDSHEEFARAVVGSMALQVRDLSSSAMREFLPLGELRFAEINADFRLASDGSRLRADSLAPLRLESVKLSNANGVLLEPFTLVADAAFSAVGRVYGVDVNELSLAFAQRSGAALNGRFTGRIEPDKTVPLQQLALDLNANLPQWLAQPVGMPGHSLRGGQLVAKVAVNPTGEIAAAVGLEALAGAKALRISRIDIPIKGTMASDGQGFDFSAPITAQGRSGVSNAALEVSFKPVLNEPNLLDFSLKSAVFYLNDLLATLSEIAPAAAPDASGRTPAAPARRVAVRVNDARDLRATWDVLPYSARLRVEIGKLFYTDYLAFEGLLAELETRRDRLSINELAANFHDSRIQLKGQLSFAQDLPEPYTLALNGEVKDFDLQKFLSELVPGEKAQVEGLFGVTLLASGESPNLSQLHNRALFDLHLTSRKGVFRPLSKANPLLIGSSGLMGLLGECLSYVPSDGFGAGAVARLVNYISRIDYDLVEIYIQRKRSRTLRLSRFLVQSPTVLLLAEGQVDYVPGADFFDSPLKMTGSLNMRARGAAILYSMGLLRDEQDPFGYFKGPEFLVSGTPEHPVSNLSTIISRAGQGALKGGFTRPLSGLIGNLKFRWFGPKEAPRSVLPVDANEAE